MYCMVRTVNNNLLHKVSEQVNLKVFITSEKL